MFDVEWTPEARANYANLKKKAESAYRSRQGKRGAKGKKSTKDEGLFKQVCKTIQYLRADTRHPGLQTHEYDSLSHPWDPSKKVFEAYVQNNTPGAYRLFWCYGPNDQEITIIAITPHP